MLPTWSGVMAVKPWMALPGCRWCSSPFNSFSTGLGLTSFSTFTTWNWHFMRSSLCTSPSLLVSILLNPSTKQLLIWWCHTWHGSALLVYLPIRFGEWTHPTTASRQTRRKIKRQPFSGIMFHPSYIPTLSKRTGPQRKRGEIPLIPRIFLIHAYLEENLLFFSEVRFKVFFFIFLFWFAGCIITHGTSYSHNPKLLRERKECLGKMWHCKVNSHSFTSRINSTDISYWRHFKYTCLPTISPHHSTNPLLSIHQLSHHSMCSSEIYKKKMILE